MNTEIKIISVPQLRHLVDAGQSRFKVKLAPGISYKKEIIPAEHGGYIVTTFGNARVVTSEQLDSQSDIVLNQINKGRLWTA